MKVIRMNIDDDDGKFVGVNDKIVSLKSKMQDIVGL